MFKFWPFPLLRYRSTSKSLSRLFLDFAEAPDLHLVGSDEYYTEVKCSLGLLRFWSANGAFACASNGVAKLQGRNFEWRQVMPSRYAVRAMQKALDRVLFAVPSTEKEAA